MAENATIEGRISRVGTKPDGKMSGIQIEGYESWFNVGGRYLPPPLQVGMDVFIEYGTGQGQDGSPRYWLNLVQARGQAAPVAPVPPPVAGPTPVALPQPSVEGYQEAAKPADREVFIIRQSSAKVAAEWFAIPQSSRPPFDEFLFTAEAIEQWVLSHKTATHAEPAYQEPAPAP